jgi:hypothetical protein
MLTDNMFSGRFLSSEASCSSYCWRMHVARGILIKFYSHESRIRFYLMFDDTQSMCNIVLVMCVNSPGGRDIQVIQQWLSCILAEQAKSSGAPSQGSSAGWQMTPRLGSPNTPSRLDDSLHWTSAQKSIQSASGSAGASSTSNVCSLFLWKRQKKHAVLTSSAPASR